MAKFARSSGLLLTTEADGTAIHTTTDETALNTAHELKAGTLHDGDRIIVRGAVVYGSTSTPNITLTVRLTDEDAASTDQVASGTVAAGGAGGRMTYEAIGIVRSLGATGTIMWRMVTHSNIAALNAVVVGSAVVTVKTEEDQDLDVTWEWSASSASNTVVGHDFEVEIAPAP